VARTTAPRGRSAPGASRARGGVAEGGDIGESRVAEVLAFISVSYRQPLTRNDLAHRVNLSPSRLHSLFRRHGKTTPHAALMAVRMGKAAELLRTTHLLIKEVAAEVGVHDDSHFVRDFEAAYGLSPANFRARRFAETT